MTTTPNTVSIHPSSFSDEQPDLSKFSLEDVVSRFKDAEKKRNTKTEPENEAEVRWHLRSAPGELISSIRIVSAHLGVSRAVLTRCMSRHLIDWYINSLGLDSLSRDFDDIFDCIKKRAYSTLRYQAEHPAEFRLVGHIERCNTAISTISWVSGKLTDIHDLLGVDSGDLLTIGLMWSLTMLETRDLDNISVDKFFMPEVFNLETLIAERRIDVVALRMKYEHRELVNYSDHIFVKDAEGDTHTAGNMRTVGDNK